MKTLTSIKSAIGVVSFLAAVLAPAMGQAGDQQPANGVQGPAAITDPNVAADAGEDTLQACMARTPKDASISQRMIAEQSCWRDENDRQPFRSDPEARTASR
ncbi:MAG: hypothetical protein AB7G68_20570 [Nitrospiraceae bacterium]